MCDALFIGSDKKLSLIKFVEGETLFHIMDLSGSEQAVKDKIEKPYVYYIGSYEGCGCGFKFGVVERDYSKDLVEPEAEERGKQSLEELFKYLNEITEEGEEIVLYNCWEDEFDKPMKYECTINLNTFKLGDWFEFREKERIRIVKY